ERRVLHLRGVALLWSHLQAPEGLPSHADQGGGVMVLSPRERRTLLAALHGWLNELGFHSPSELQAAYADLGADPLTEAEVEALRVRVAATDDHALISEVANAEQVLAGRSTYLRQMLGRASDHAVEFEAVTDRV